MSGWASEGGGGRGGVSYQNFNLRLFSQRVRQNVSEREGHSSVIRHVCNEPDTESRNWCWQLLKPWFLPDVQFKSL